MNTLYVDSHRASVGVRSKSLEVRIEGRLAGRFPLAGLESVVISGAGQITTTAIERCVENGVRVAAIRRRGGLHFAVGGPTSGNVLLRVAQVRLADDVARANGVARVVVAGKLQNARRLMARWAWDATPIVKEIITEQNELIGACIERLAWAPNGDAIRGLEGEATRRYFKALGAHLESRSSGFVMEKRSRRPPRDPVNALMSFMYGLLVAELVGACDACGLDPQVGFLHGMRPGRPSLALDLIEEFRAGFADRFAISLLTRRQLREEHFVKGAGGAVYLDDEGRRIVFDEYEAYRSEEVHHPLLGHSIPRSSLPVAQATIMARFVRGDLPQYAPWLTER